MQEKTKVLEKREVLEQTGLSTYSLRHYIKFFKGIIPGCLYKKPLKKSRGSRAYYSQKTVTMINLIRKENQKGKKLSEIRMDLYTEKAVDKEFKKRKLKRKPNIPVITQISNPDLKVKVFIGNEEVEKGLKECLGEPIEVTIKKNGTRVEKWNKII